MKSTHLTRPCNCGNAPRGRGRFSRCKAQGGRAPRPLAGDDENAWRIRGLDSLWITSVPVVLWHLPCCTTVEAGLQCVIDQTACGVFDLHAAHLRRHRGRRAVFWYAVVAVGMSLMRRVLPSPFGSGDAFALILEIVDVGNKESARSGVEDRPPASAVRFFAPRPPGRHGITDGCRESLVRGANELTSLGGGLGAGPLASLRSAGRALRRSMGIRIVTTSIITSNSHRNVRAVVRKGLLTLAGGVHDVLLDHASLPYTVSSFGALSFGRTGASTPSSLGPLATHLLPLLPKGVIRRIVLEAASLTTTSVVGALDPRAQTLGQPGEGLFSWRSDGLTSPFELPWALGRPGPTFGTEDDGDLAFRPTEPVPVARELDQPVVHRRASANFPTVHLRKSMGSDPCRAQGASPRAFGVPP